MSTLVLSAKREMHGGKLSCKVENPLVPNSQIKDGQKLQIHCKYFTFYSMQKQLLQVVQVLMQPAKVASVYYAEILQYTATLN